jgi:hypothetical protein
MDFSIRPRGPEDAPDPSPDQSQDAAAPVPDQQSETCNGNR